MKEKYKCHICGDSGKTKKDEPVPENCPRCLANLVDTTKESVIIETTAIGRSAGGVKAEIITIHFTNKRILFIGESTGSAFGGGVVGGLIGSLLNPMEVEVRTADFKSLEETVKGLFKNKVQLTITTKDGKIYPMTLPKKEAEAWRVEINKFI